MIFDIAIVTTADAPRILLLHKRTTSELSTGWELPSGRIDPSESGAQSVQRIVTEVTGQTFPCVTRNADESKHQQPPAAQLLFLDNYTITPHKHGVMSVDNITTGVWLCLANEEFNTTLSPKHDQFKWETVSDADRLLPPGDRSFRMARERLRSWKLWEYPHIVAQQRK